MLDEQGYLHAWPPAVEQQADPQAVRHRAAGAGGARAAGWDRHRYDIDAHMGTVFSPRFIQSYIDVARENRLPPFLLSRDGAERLRVRTSGRMGDTDYPAHLWEDLEARGVALFDDMAMLPLHDPADHIAIAKRIVDGLQPGLTVLILHPAQDTPELRAIAPDWRCRVANYEACLSGELRDHMRQSGVQLIGYRPLREALRAENREQRTENKRGRMNREPGALWSNQEPRTGSRIEGRGSRIVSTRSPVHLVTLSPCHLVTLPTVGPRSSIVKERRLPCGTHSS